MISMRLKLIVLALLSCLCLFGFNQSKLEQRINEGLNAVSELSEEDFYNAGYEFGRSLLKFVYR